MTTPATINKDLYRWARYALQGNWEYAQLFRYATRGISRKRAAELAGITVYKVDKIGRTRYNGTETIIYSVKEWRELNK